MKIQGKFILILSLIAALAVMTGLSAGAADSDPANVTDAKQMGAPPSDFAELQLPDPAEIGSRSAAAIVPVTLQSDGSGGLVWDGALHIDNGADATITVFAPEVGQWSITLHPDSEEAIVLNSQMRRPDVTRQLSEVSLGDEAGFLGEAYTFTQLAEGSVPVQVTAVASPAATSGSDVDGFIVVLNQQSPYHIYSYLNTHNLVVGNEIGFVAYGYDHVKNSEGTPEAMTGLIQEARLTLTKADSRNVELAMFDDGLHADGAANDGVFGVFVEADVAGDYIGQVSMMGTTPEGHPFMRTSEHAFPVLDANLSLDESLTRVSRDGDRLQIKLRADGVDNVPEQLHVAAQVWGANAADEMVPVAWVGGIVTPIANGNQLVLPLHLDANWIGMAGATSNFELRDVRVQDVDTYIPIAQSDVIALASFRLPAAARQAVTEITDTMLMGERPESLEAPRSPEAGKLMLVHGYCSGITWPQSQFTNDVTFLDYRQNRTHNQFAQLIRNYGNNFSSFGIVAHSQGGAASLELYAKFWSRLNYATGPRLIQSVGTPYRGTRLAGFPATMGKIFHQSCGYNYNLTENGAAQWLSTIPSWARSRIYYHTTSHKKPHWYSLPWCSAVTEPFLWYDVDDGVVEKWAGQLAGGNNLGHKTGWCHSVNMNNPRHTSDSARNANMNAYAAR